MPNHDTTRLVVTAERPEDLWNFLFKYRSVEEYEEQQPRDESQIVKPCLSDAFRPMPLALRDTVSPRDDPNSWYQWASNNWGTKWGTYEESHKVNEGEVVITFNSAWSPPWALLHFISENHPVKLSGTWYSEYDDSLSRFEIENGEEVTIVRLGEMKTFQEEPEGATHHFELDGTPIVPPRFEPYVSPFPD